MAFHTPPTCSLTYRPYIPPLMNWSELHTVSLL